MKPETLPTLKAFQKWRLGETDEMPGDDATYPKRLTAALDDAIATLERLKKASPHFTLSQLEEILTCPH
jgi:hypothetical protein